VATPGEDHGRVARAIDWSARYGPEAAEDEAVVRECYEELTGVMQATLDRLAAERRFRSSGDRPGPGAGPLDLDVVIEPELVRELGHHVAHEGLDLCPPAPGQPHTR